MNLKLSRVISFLWVCCILVSPSLLADEIPRIVSGDVSKGGIRVTDIGITPEDSWYSGTLVYSFLLSNTTSKAQMIEWQCNGRFIDCVFLEGKMTLDAQASTNLLIPLPPVKYCRLLTLNFTDNGGKFYFSPKNEPVCDSYSSIRGNHYWNFSYNKSLVFASQSLDEQVFRDSISKPKSEKSCTNSDTCGAEISKSSYPNEDGENFHVAIRHAGKRMEHWPTDWREYTPYGLCVICEKDLADIPLSGRVALANYAFSGGVVLFLGDKDSLLRIVKDSFTGIDNGAIERGGSADDGGFPYGLGMVFVWECDNPSEFQENQVADLQWVALRRAVFDRESLFTSYTLHHSGNCYYDGMMGEFFFKKTSAVFLYIIFAFTMIAGPVLWFVLKKYDKRIHILWLLPVISVVFSFAIFLYNLFAEGITPYIKTDGFTYIMGKEGKSVTVAGMTIYSPQAFGRDILFDFDSDICPIYGGNGDIFVGSDVLHYSGNWVKAKLQSEFGIRRVSDTSVGLEIIPSAEENGTPMVVNTFGVKVKTLTYWDSDGRVWEADNLAIGEKAVFRETKREPKELISNLSRKFNQGRFHYEPETSQWKDVVLGIPFDGRCRLPRFKNCYYAEYEGSSPFIKHPIGDRKAHCEMKGTVFCTLAGKDEQRQKEEE